ncbi:hypothetical protein [Tessaracoccus sp. OH4464_COT-324]|uniref:hypothetical protein n=1 Tax=Tessaracoccus sp. OH4464_COT-324 TaxID=2491059 RepID=UPI000F62EA72|nr:hypothetical protein [Tessaracoccus sp. OH4464_COT-324]RRD45637.1 hypothetical protein EII42_10680 [Tessaracoccus sp. OH4464_COT-324]
MTDQISWAAPEGDPREGDEPQDPGATPTLGSPEGAEAPDPVQPSGPAPAGQLAPQGAGQAAPSAPGAPGFVAPQFPSGAPGALGQAVSGGHHAPGQFAASQIPGQAGSPGAWAGGPQGSGAPGPGFVAAPGAAPRGHVPQAPPPDSQYPPTQPQDAPTWSVPPQRPVALKPSGPPSGWPVWTLTIGLVVALIGVTAWLVVSRRPAAEPAPEPVVSTAVESPTPQPHPQSSSPTPPGPSESGSRVPDPQPNPPQLPEPTFSPLIPMVEDYPAVVVNNRLYELIPPQLTGCPTPKLITSEQEWRQEVRAQWACVHNSWLPIIKQQGWPEAMPEVQFFPGKGSKSDCGYFEAPAFYCARGQGSVFFGGEHRDMAKQWEYSINEMVNHEYGHHLQFLSGIHEGAFGTGAFAEDAPRRSELQAVCWSGMMTVHNDSLNFDGATYESWQQRLRTMLESPRHGNRNSLTDWGTRGLYAKTLGDCNTWVVTKEQVS